MDNLISRIKDKWPQMKLYVLIALVSIGMAIGVGISEGDSDNQLVFEKSEPGENMQKENYILNIPGIVEDYPYEIVVENRHLTLEEQKKYFNSAIVELEEKLVGDNDSLEHIVTPLDLVSSLQNGLIDVKYTWTNHRILNYAGEPVQKNLVEEGSLVEITAWLSYEDVHVKHVFYVRVYPPEKNLAQKAIEAIENVITAQNESDGAEVILPGRIGKTPVFWTKDKGTNKVFVILLMGIVAIAGVAIGRRNDARKAKKNRDGILIEEYSGVLNQLSLLLSAGMTVSNAWERVVKNYQSKLEGKKNKDRKPAYEEMEITYNQIKDGMAERQAYEQFADRVGVAEYRKLSNLLTQNLRKGTAGLGRILEEEAVDAYSKQQSIVKKKGEEMSTKLLLPMMLMLGLVIVMIVIPAVFNFGM